MEHGRRHVTVRKSMVYVSKYWIIMDERYRLYNSLCVHVKLESGRPGLSSQAFAVSLRVAISPSIKGHEIDCFHVSCLDRRPCLHPLTPWDAREDLFIDLARSMNIPIAMLYYVGGYIKDIE
jgi:hypothetical protein